ncbi:MAG: transglutaminase domain-containing protein [Candidatus Hadarchaeales archaeon]
MRRLWILGILLPLTVAAPVFAAEPTKSVVYRTTMTYEVRNNGPGEAIDVIATICIFKDWSDWASQRVIATDALPGGEILDAFDNRVLTVPLGTIHAGESKTIVTTQIIKVDYVDRRPLDPNVIANSVSPGFGYLSQIEGLWESEAPEIRDKALELTAEETNLYFKTEKIFDFVKDYLGYEKQAEEHGALWAYMHRVGDCTEFTNLFIALCRASGIPAKFVASYGYKPELEEDLEGMGHALAIVYLPNHGWVPVDLTWPLGVGSFCELGTDRIILATSDGIDMIKDGEIRPPGGYRVDYSFVVGSPADCQLVLKDGTISREVAVESKISPEPRIEDGVWRFSVLIRNAGRRTVANVNVELLADVAYFEVPPAQSLKELDAGASQIMNFDVRIKGGVERSTLKARVTYDCDYGTFVAEDELQVSVPTPVIPEDIWRKLRGALLPILLAAIIVVATVLVVRRR